jgi:hypothetical protein
MSPFHRVTKFFPCPFTCVCPDKELKCKDIRRFPTHFPGYALTLPKEKLSSAASFTNSSHNSNLQNNNVLLIASEVN